jgi:hypothetical protein
MNEEIKKTKAIVLSDEETEKVSGGGELIGTVEKRCLACYQIYSHTLEKCPSCSSIWCESIIVYPKPNTGGGPR